MSVRIRKAFEGIGARVTVAVRNPQHIQGRGSYTLDIGEDEKGEEFFDIRVARGSGVKLTIIDKKPEDRHLLLVVHEDVGRYEERESRFLCGFDEQHWFAAPVAPDANDIARAKESLKPESVRQLQTRRGGGKKRVKGGIKRQGEWFFIQKRKMKVPHNQILKNEPIQRGAGKPHVVAELWRIGGQDAYVPMAAPWRSDVKEADIPDEWFGGLSAGQHASLMRRKDELGKLAKRLRWRIGKVDARVFGRGRITHPDHNDLVLDVWHEIVPNAESRFAAEEGNLRFID